MAHVFDVQRSLVASDAVLVFIVWANPEPVDTPILLQSEDTVAFVHTGGPVGTDSLEVQGRVPVVGLPEGYCFRARS